MLADIYYKKNVKTNYTISLNEFKVLAEHANFTVLRKWNAKKHRYELSNQLCNLVYEVYLQLNDFKQRKEWLQSVANHFEHDCHYIRSAAKKYTKA